MRKLRQMTRNLLLGMIRRQQLRLAVAKTQEVILRLALRGRMPAKNRTPRRLLMLRAQAKVLRLQQRINLLQRLLERTA